MKAARIATVSGLILSAIAVPAMADVRALIVGIGNYSPDTGFPPLEGPPNDARMVQQWLTADWAARTEQVLRINESQATSPGIQEAIDRHLVRGARPEDVALIYFSGHGGQVPDLDGDETDGHDEVLITHDYREQEPITWLTDDVLHRHLQAIPARHVFILFDCCHAGTATRGIKGAANPFAWKTRSATSPSTSLREKSAPDHHVYIAACGDGEFARQMPAAEGVVGVFTYGFLELMRGEIAGAPLDTFQQTLQEHLSRMVREKINDKLDQRPRLEASRRDFSLRALMKGQVFDVQAPLPPPPADPGVIGGFTPSGPIKLTLETDREAYRWTESLTATVRVDRPSHVRVFHVDSTGSLTQIHPNAIQQETLLQAGATLRLPPATPVNGRTYQLRITAPNQGLEALIAVASTRPFTDREAHDFAGGLFTALPDTTATQAMTRGIQVEARPGSGLTSPATSAQADVGPPSHGQAISIFRTSQY